MQQSYSWMMKRTEKLPKDKISVQVTKIVSLFDTWVYVNSSANRAVPSDLPLLIKSLIIN